MYSDTKYKILLKIHGFWITLFRGAIFTMTYGNRLHCVYILKVIQCESKIIPTKKHVVTQRCTHRSLSSITERLFINWFMIYLLYMTFSSVVSIVLNIKSYQISNMIFIFSNEKICQSTYLFKSRNVMSGTLHSNLCYY